MNMALCICREQEEEDYEDQVEEAEKEDDEEEEEANIEEYELNCFKPSIITNSLFPGQRVCVQQDLDFLSKIRKKS